HEPGEARPEAPGPFVLAEGAERGGGRPVLQGRLLEVLVAVDARGQPVAGRDHLARDLGVAAFVGLGEMPVAQVAEPGEREEGEDREEAAPRHSITSAAATLRPSAMRML